MIDHMTQKPVRVLPDSSIVLPLSQLDQLKAVLDAHKIAYEVGDEVLSVDGKPEVAFVDLERDVDSETVQQLLDSIP